MILPDGSCSHASLVYKLALRFRSSVLITHDAIERVKKKGIANGKSWVHNDTYGGFLFM